VITHVLARMGLPCIDEYPFGLRMPGRRGVEQRTLR
jgi:hypothetical protein